MPSPLGHAMAGAMTAWIAESRPQQASEPAFDASGSPTLIDRLARAVTPLTVACAVLAISPDFDVFFHTHRTYTHSLGAVGVVWLVVALVAWRLRLPVVRIATTCAAAYASHVLLDWLGRDESGGLMALWPLTSDFYSSGLDLFLEIGGSPRAVVHHPATGFLRAVIENWEALVREVLVVGTPFLLVLWRRLKGGTRPGTRAGHRAVQRGPQPRTGASPAMPLRRQAQNGRG